MDVCGLAWPPRRRARDATSRRSLGSHAGLMGMSSSTPVAEVIASAPVVVFAASWSVWKSDFTAPAQDNLTRSQVVVSLLQAGQGRAQRGGHRVQGRRSNGRPEGRIKGIDGQDERAAGIRQGPVHRRLQRWRTRRHGPAPEERQAPGDASVDTHNNLISHHVPRAAGRR